MAGICTPRLHRPTRSIRPYLKHDLLVVRVQGDLSPAEVRLLDMPNRGRDLVKTMLHRPGGDGTPQRALSRQTTRSLIR